MFTSYFANVKKVPPELMPVSIARGSPRWFTGRNELRLAPTWAMLKLTKPEYDAAYAEILAKLDPAEMYQTLDENAVLLCWEKPWDACHRRLVAEWLEAALSIEIPEYGFNRRACPAYDEMIWAVKRRADASSVDSKPASEPEEQLHVYPLTRRGLQLFSCERGVVTCNLTSRDWASATADGGVGCRGAQ